ncbi:MAG: flagellar biosynthetic protein FliP, partial [Amphiplicatus sp.]
MRLAFGLAAFLAAILIMTGAASAQDITSAAEGGLSLRVVQLFVLVTVLSLAPGLAMMITCLPFMIIVFSILRQAIGLQQAPPNMLIMSLALFLTYFVMEPVFAESWRLGVAPLLQHDITEQQAFQRALAPFETFMSGRVSPVALDALTEVAPARAAEGSATPLSVLIPA